MRIPSRHLTDVTLVSEDTDDHDDPDDSDDHDDHDVGIRKGTPK